MIVGIADHAGWAIAVTVDGDGRLVDKRQLELVEPGVPCMPHHVEGQRLPVLEAVALVARVRASAEREVEKALAGLEELGVQAIALRVRQPLPPTVEERLGDYRARNVADWVMYRDVLAEVAMARGWRMSWYDGRKVFGLAAGVLGCADIEAHLAAVGKAAGRPWQKDHKVAMAAAIVAGASWRPA